MKERKVEKEKKHNYKFILGIIIGGVVFGLLGVYAATQIASSNVTYTNNSQENVQGAIDDLYDKFKNYAKVEKCSGSDCKKCKRATMLHTEKCESSKCQSAGYAESESITYGNLGTAGTLTSGDAFDCDVNGDGYYDPLVERFYYVSEYYNTSTKQFESDTAVLIYYNNVSEGTTNNSKTYAYNEDENKINYNGPVTAMAQLPTTSQWKNVSLKNTSRAIKNETGGTTTTGGTLPTSYSYAGKAARLLTAQELNAACAITVGSAKTGELDTCQYLMENTSFSNNSLTYGYWLETPRSSYSFDVWSVDSNRRNVNYNDAFDASRRGVRPAIEVSVTEIQY